MKDLSLIEYLLIILIPALFSGFLSQYFQGFLLTFRRQTYRRLFDTRKRSIQGKWEGDAIQNSFDFKNKKTFKMRVKLKIWGLRVRADVDFRFPGSNELTELRGTGRFMNDRFITLTYSPKNNKHTQFGSCTMLIGSLADQAEIKAVFSGFGPYTEDLLVGCVPLKKVN